MTDQRQPYLIVRPAEEPTAKQRAALRASEDIVGVKDWSGRMHWFHIELASVWPLELDG